MKFFIILNLVLSIFAPCLPLENVVFELEQIDNVFANIAGATGFLFSQFWPNIFDVESLVGIIRKPEAYKIQINTIFDLIFKFSK